MLNNTLLELDLSGFLNDKVLEGRFSLDLSHNNLVGKIPTKHTNLTTMVTLDLSNNYFTGFDSAYGSFQSLYSIQLSNNNIEGGMVFATTIDTLTQRDSESMLAAMFSGRHRLCKDSKGIIFIDRDGTHFRHILNWLRIGVLPTLDMASYQELLREAEYYQLIGLMEKINAVLNKKEDEEEKPELTRKEILKCIQTEHVRLRGVNLSGQDLSKLHLVQADFSCARLINTFFSRANLRSANFSYAEADGSNFHNAILRECIFTRASLRGSLLAGANLQSASLQDACLVSCSFCEANLQSAHLQGADLTNANLSGANLEGANLKGATLVGANLRRANLQRVYLRDANLKDSNLEGANLEGANLQNASR